MDTTPLLQRSSSSPQNSYCPSEASSLEYHSPSLIAQQYSLSSLYVTGSFCSMESNQDSEIPLFALDTSQHTSWDHPATTLSSTSLSGLSAGLSTGLPTALSVEYEPYQGFAPSIQPTYSSALYSNASQRPASLAGTHSPSASGAHTSLFARSRSPLSFSDTAPVLPSSTNIYQPGVATSMPAYGRIGDRSHYQQQPRPVQYSQQAGSPDIYGSASTGSGNASGGLSGYFPVDSSSVWRSPVTATEPLYSTSGGSHSHVRHHTPTYSSDGQQRASRARRQPRRLTTREEANFQCEVRGCGKLFSRSYNYKAHMETHDEGREYPFPCQVPGCDRKFVRKTDLQRHHQSVHAKERNHKCDYCGRLFARKDTLRR